MAHDAPEIVRTERARVACEGHGGALGHPRVWYEIGDAGFVDCGDCDRRSERIGGPADPGADADAEALGSDG